MGPGIGGARTSSRCHDPGGEKIRTFEALLVLGNLLAFAASTVSLPRAVPWMRYSAPIALLIAVAQVLVEGARWQMIPSYVLTDYFFLVWLLKDIAPPGRPAERTRTRRVAFGLAVGVGAVALAVSITLPTVLPVFRLPDPGGPYEIGALTYDWGTPVKSRHVV